MNINRVQTLFMGVFWLSVLAMTAVAGSDNIWFVLKSFGLLLIVALFSIIMMVVTGSDEEEENEENNDKEEE